MRTPGPKERIVEGDYPSTQMLAWMRQVGPTAADPIHPGDFGGSVSEKLTNAMLEGIATGRPVQIDGMYVLDDEVAVEYAEGSLTVVGSGTIHVPTALLNPVTITATYPAAVTISAFTQATHSFPGDSTTAGDATKITAAGHGCAIGDLIKIVAEDQIAGSTSSSRRVGEFAYVADVSGNDLWVSGRLTETYTTSPRLVRVSKEARLVWDGPGFSSETAAQSAMSFLTVRGFVQPFIRSSFRDGFHIGLYLSSCVQAEAEVECIDMLNRAASETIAGYAVQDTASWMSKVMVGAVDARHAYTTITNSASNGDAAWKYGRTRGAVVRGVAMACSSAAFDVHTEASDVTFIGCSTAATRFGEDASGAGFGLRGRRTKVVDCIDYGSQHGLNFHAQVAGDSVDCEVVNFQYEGTGMGVRVNQFAADIVATRPRVRGGTIKTSGNTSVAAWACTNAVIEDLRLAPTGSATHTGIALGGNASVLVRNIYVDLSGYTGTAFRLASFTSTGNSLIIESARIVGATGKFEAWFNGGDTTGTVELRTDRMLSDAAPTDQMINAGSVTITAFYGSSGDGKWIKHPTGDLEIWNSVNLGSRIAAGTGTYADPYRTALASWPFPQTFLEAPKITATPVVALAALRGIAHSVGIASVSTTAATDMGAVACSDLNTDADVHLHLHAKGRWRDFGDIETA